MDYGARRGVAKVLYAKFILFVLELGWLVIGSFWATAEYEDCDPVVVATVRVLVALSWIGVIVFIVMFGEFYNKYIEYELHIFAFKRIYIVFW